MAYDGNPFTRGSSDPRDYRNSAVQYSRRGRGGYVPGSSSGSSSSTPISSSPGHPRGGGPAAAQGRADRYDPAGAVGGVLADIAAAFDAERQAIYQDHAGGGYGGGGGGGGSGYGDAIKEAQEILDDIVANRAAIKEVYGEYDRFIDPQSKDAIAAAAAIVKQGQPAFDAIAKAEKEGIADSFDLAARDIAKEAALIHAGKPAAKSVQKEAGEGEALLIANAIAEATQAKDVLKLTQNAATSMAKAQEALDKGDVQREEELVDLQLGELEKEAQKQIEELRKAAASAAAGGYARRSAGYSARNQDLDLLSQDQYLAMRLSPHEAGEATTLNYLSQNAGHLDYNRQQLILSTVSNAISQQVRPSDVARYASANGVSLSSEEARIASNGVSAYQSGMRHQQDSDRQKTIDAGRRGAGGWYPQAPVGGSGGYEE